MQPSIDCGGGELVFELDATAIAAGPLYHTLFVSLIEHVEELAYFALRNAFDTDTAVVLIENIRFDCTISGPQFNFLTKNWLALALATL